MNGFMSPCSSRLAALAALLVILVASPLRAQTSVRVKSDLVPVWNPGFATIATTVKEGTVLESVGEQGNWFEVVVPGASQARRSTGFIAKSRVEVVTGTSPAGSASQPARPETPRGDRPSQTRSQTRTQPRPGAATPTFRVFGEAGYGRFAARQTFDAVLGSPGGSWLGGGVMYQRRSGLFVQGGVEHFGATGERVFVLDGTVYPLGIADTVSITPVMAGVGFRSRAGRGLSAYVGAGAGVYLLRETSEFADPADNVKQTNGAYRGFAGVELPLMRHVAAALEVQYTTVPDALTGNTADAFDEHDLGGAQVKVKLLFGR